MGEASHMEDCGAIVTGASALLGLRLGALFGILLASAAGIVLPYLTNFAKLHNVIFLMKAFAGGVVLATGFLHILGDAVEDLSDPCLGWPDYQWAMMIACAASLITFTFEWHLHKHFASVAATAPPQPTDHSECTDAACAEHHLVQVSVAHPLRQCGTDNCAKTVADLPLAAKDKLQQLTASVQSCTLEIGIIFHSIFIGIALGLNRDRAAVQSLMIALMFHQFNEGLAIGLTFLAARYSAMRYALLGATFILTTPIGVAIGIWVGTSKYSAATLLGVTGTFNSISAGILLYNAFVDLIVPTFSVQLGPGNSVVQTLGFVALFLGAGVMCLIGWWA